MNTRRCAVGIGLFVFVIGWMSSHAVAAQWASAPSLNVPRQLFAAEVDECGNIWALGGWNRTGGCGSGTGPVLSSVEKLSFDGISYAATWELTPIVMPIPRMYHSVVISRGFIYVLGGGVLGAQFPLAQVDRFDTLSGTWNSNAVPPPNVPRFEASAIADPLGRIWIIGGYSEAGTGNTVATVEIFDPARPQLGWQAGPSLNQARMRFGCVLDLEGRIYAIGGYNAPNEVQTIERIDPCGSSQWSLLPVSLPGAPSVDDPAVLGADGYIYVVGGWIPHTYTDRVLRLDPESVTLETWSPLTLARTAHRVVSGRDDHIYAIGGSVSGCNSSVDVEKLYTGRPTCDINGDGEVNGLDIAPLIQCMLGP